MVEKSSTTPKDIKKDEKSPKMEEKKPRKPERLRYKQIVRARKIKSLAAKKVEKRLRYLRLKKICIKHAQKHLRVGACIIFMVVSRSISVLKSAR